MRTVIRNVLQAAVAVVFIVGVHGAEIVSAASDHSSSHECGCAEGCSCQGNHDGCGSPQAALKSSCGCGCGGRAHEATGSSLETVLASTCAACSPYLTWSLATCPAEFPVWGLAHEPEHPPRFLS